MKTDAETLAGATAYGSVVQFRFRPETQAEYKILDALMEVFTKGGKVMVETPVQHRFTVKPPGQNWHWGPGAA